MPYALIPIGLSALLFYGFTFILSRAGLISTTIHRRIWNSTLLITFFTTAVLGIIMAVQINYKLDMPVVDKLIIWHVDFGIGMSFIAVFHFTWHWSYYKKLLSRKKTVGTVDQEPFPANLDTGYRSIPLGDTLPLFTLGATALITQIVFLREYLAIFHGNELVVGVILAGWLLLTGTGALIGKNIDPGSLRGNSPSYAFLLLGILPLITVLAVRFFKNLVFPVGSISGIPGILLYSIAGMSLFCLLSGFLFTWLSSWLSIKHGRNLLNLGYAVESAGSIAAGILFSFLLVHVLNTFQILFILFLLNGITAAASRGGKQQNRLLAVSGLIAVLIAAGVFWVDLDLVSRSFLFPNQDLVETRDTPYGNLVVSKTGEQYTLFENSAPIAASADIASVEEDVHYAMVQHLQPESVLVFSGNLQALTEELEKYHVKQVDFVELNPWVTRMRDRYLPRAEVPWLRIIHMDGRRYLEGTDQTYDVVLVNFPPPGSAQLNRFYTAEFFSRLKSHMNQGGILSVPLQGTENYPSQEAADLHSILYQTLKLHFKNILLVPGLKTYFLASDTRLDLDIPSLIEEREIETLYVNSYYLDTLSLNERSSQLMSNISESARINKDFRPTAYLHQINYWLSYFSSNLWITLGIFLLLIFLIGSRAGTMGQGIFVAGFTGMGIELVLLLAIQIVFGYMYLYTAVILTVFMMGLAAGALSVSRILSCLRPRHFALFQLILAICVFLVFWWLLLIEERSVPTALLHAGFLILTLLASFVTGTLFATAALLGKQGIARTAGGLYSADLAGSAAGALVMAVLMIPLLGLNDSLLVLLLLNMLAFLNSLLRPSR